MWKKGVHIYDTPEIHNNFLTINGCCTTPVNVIKIEIKYSCLFRDMKKVEYLMRDATSIIFLQQITGG